MINEDNSTCILKNLAITLPADFTVFALFEASLPLQPVTQYSRIEDEKNFDEKCQIWESQPVNSEQCTIHCFFIYCLKLFVLSHEKLMSDENETNMDCSELFL